MAIFIVLGVAGSGSYFMFFSHADAGSPILYINQSLVPNQALVSATGNYRLIEQPDGNLVIYNSASQPVWQDNTYGQSPGHLIMQPDGNLVNYNSAGQAIWQSGTFGTGPGDYVVMQDDGNLVIHNSANQPVWSWETGRLNPAPISVGTSLSINQKLFPNEYLIASNGYRVQLQTDGNLVVRDPSNSVIWQTGTAGTGAAYLIMQPDGNLVLYNWLNQAVWQSGTEGMGTNGYTNDVLIMQPDGNLVVYATGGQAVWSWMTGRIVPKPTAAIDGPDTDVIGDSPIIEYSSTNANSCTINNAAVSGTNGSINEPAISTDTTYVLQCKGPGGTATNSVVVHAVQAHLPAMPSASPASTGGGGVKTNPKVSLTQPLSHDLNWAGEALNGGNQEFTEIEGSIKIPNFSCSNNPQNFSETSIWIGLDGYSSPSVEQTGIDLICGHYKRGWVKTVSSWWEMYSAHDRQQRGPSYYSSSFIGDQINMKVWYDRSNNKYGLSLTDISNPSYLKINPSAQSCANGVSCQNSSAEWVVERASYSGHLYPLVDFNPVTFTDVYASTVPSYKGSQFANYPNTPINIRYSANNDLVSLPAQVYEGTSAFTIDLLREI